MYKYTHFMAGIIVSLPGFKLPSPELLPTPDLQKRPCNWFRCLVQRGGSGFSNKQVLLVRVLGLKGIK